MVRRACLEWGFLIHEPLTMVNLSVSPTRGLLWAGLGVAAFSLTFPLTRVALETLPGDWVGVGRGALASVLAAGYLIAVRAPLPARRHWLALALVSVCAVLVFPWLIAHALQTLSAGHAAIAAGIVPLLTALIAVLRGGERPALRFWLAASAGALGLALYAGSRLRPDSVDLGTAGLDAAGFGALAAAMLASAVAYAEGGKLARELGGWRVMAWSVALALPLLLPLAWAAWPTAPAPLSAWLAFAYLGLVSQLLAFYPWYRGMAQAGIARAAQVQQLQVFITLGVASLWLGETLTGWDAAAALWVAGCVIVAQRSPWSAA